MHIILITDTIISSLTWIYVVISKIVIGYVACYTGVNESFGLPISAFCYAWLTLSRSKKRWFPERLFDTDTKPPVQGGCDIFAN